MKINITGENKISREWYPMKLKLEHELKKKKPAKTVNIKYKQATRAGKSCDKMDIIKIL